MTYYYGYNGKNAVVVIEMRTWLPWVSLDEYVAMKAMPLFFS